jgi:hypothetical protein
MGKVEPQITPEDVESPKIDESTTTEQPLITPIVLVAPESEKE